MVKWMIWELAAAGWGNTMVILSDRKALRELREMDLDAGFLFNDDPDRGMISSLRIGLDWAGEAAEGLLGWPVDCPFVTRTTLSSIRRSANAENVIVPVWQGRRGHPTWWGRRYWSLLRAETADGGARNVLPHIPYGSLVELEASEEAVIININTQEDARACGIK